MQLLKVLTLCVACISICGCGGGGSSLAKVANNPSPSPSPAAPIVPPDNFSAHILSPGPQAIYTWPHYPVSVQFTTDIPGTVTWTEGYFMNNTTPWPTGGMLLENTGLLDIPYFATQPTVYYACTVTATSSTNPKVHATASVFLY